MNDNGSADDLFRPEAIGVNSQKSGAFSRREQRGKVAAMPRMGNPVEIIMGTGGSKGDVAAGGAVSVLMNMEPHESRGWQSQYACQDQGSPTVGREEYLAH